MYTDPLCSRLVFGKHPARERREGGKEGGRERERERERERV